MTQGYGLPVFPGVAIGNAVVYRKAERVLPVSSGDANLEKAKFESARETAREQLTALYEKAKVEIGEEQAAIIEVQMLMLDDLDYLEGVAAAIEGGADAVIEFFNKKPVECSAVDVATGLILIERYQRAGDFEGAQTVAQKLRDIGTVSGQAVQIFSIIGRFTSMPSVDKIFNCSSSLISGNLSFNCISL